MYLRLTAVLFFLAVLPTSSHAQVAISEVMYDPAGTDTKREWVEVCNVSSGGVDLTTFKLFESASNHSIVMFSGESSLDAGQCGVVADDPPSFKIDYPSFSGALFDSSFSLSNSGEQLILRSAADVDIDVTTYTATAAKGDGNTLHRSGSTYSSAAASPGNETGFTAPTSGGGSDTGNVDGSQVNQNGNTATPASGVTSVINFQTVTVEPTPKLNIRVTVPEQTIVGAQTKMSAEAYNTKGQVVKAQVTWTYGDGLKDVGSEVRHAYGADGAYVVHVSATADGLSDSTIKHIDVLPVSAQISVSSDGKVISVTNTTAGTLDLTAWRLKAGGQYYTFPDNTFVLPQTTVKFTQNVTKLTEVVHSQYVELLNAANDRIAGAHYRVSAGGENAVSVSTSKTIPEPLTILGIGLAGIRHEEVPLPVTTPIVQASAQQKSTPVPSQQKVVTLPKPTLKKQNTEKDAVLQPEQSLETPTQVATVASAGFAVNPWYAGVAVLVLIGAMPFLFAQPEVQGVSAHQAPEEVSLGGLTARDFEIIEVDEEGKVKS